MGLLGWLGGVPAEVVRALERLAHASPQAKDLSVSQQAMDAFIIDSRALQAVGYRGGSTVRLCFATQVQEGSISTDVSIQEAGAQLNVVLLTEGKAVQVYRGAFSERSDHVMFFGDGPGISATVNARTVRYVHNWVRTKLLDEYRSGYLDRKAREAQEAQHAQMLRDKYK